MRRTLRPSGNFGRVARMRSWVDALGCITPACIFRGRPGSASDSPPPLPVDSQPAKEPPGRSLLGSLRGGTKPAPLGSASRKGCGGKQRESTAKSISRAPWVLECRARRRRRCFLLVAARSRRSERYRNPSRNVRGCSATMLTRGGDGNCGLEDLEIRAEPNGIDKISKSCGERLASRRFYECAHSAMDSYGDPVRD